MTASGWEKAASSIPESTGGNYYKLKDGANKFRVLSEPIQGYLYWTIDSKPVRLKEYPEVMPSNMREGDKIKFFWAFTVWSYRDSKVQIIELTQSTIQRAIADLVSNEDWGSPTKYDITVSRKGEKLDTEYTVQPSPHRDAPLDALQSLKKAPVRLEALFTGSDPFAPSSDATDDIKPEDIPF